MAGWTQVMGAVGSGVYADKEGNPQTIGGIWRLPTSNTGGGEGGDGNGSGDPFGWIAARGAEGKRNVEEGVGQAAVDVMSAYEKARQAKERNLGARGVNPSSGIYQGAQNEWALARAAAEAGARNRARMEGEKDNQGLMDRLLSMKISQYNSNRSFAAAQNSNQPTITVGGRNPTRDARIARESAKAEEDSYTKALEWARALGGGTAKAPASASTPTASAPAASTQKYGVDPETGRKVQISSNHSNPFGPLTGGEGASYI